jgi:hypothetical protein
LVYGTVAGTVHFLGIDNGLQIMEVDFGRAVDDIIITSVWGFVVVRGGAEIKVYSVNGEELKNAELPSKVVAWSGFASENAFDFITFACLGGEIGVFEVFKPKQFRIIGVCSDALFVYYETNVKCVMVVRQSGIVEWKPDIN